MTSDHSVSVLRDCDLCIVGAGYAGLNGLDAAASYLEKGQRVVVVDRGATWGGQWNDQYKFVRLQQPYSMFTAGAQKWRIPGREPSHLATRNEVLSHLASVPNRSASHLEVETLFRHEYVGHRVRSGRVEVEVLPVDGGPSVRYRAKRLLKASGLDIQMLPPFPVSSKRVRSVGIADPVLASSEFLESDAPVYIIGSGKSAMECVRWLATDTQIPRRKVAVLTGSGMWFLCRDRTYPSGLSRYTGGILPSDLMLRIIELFEGDNEVDVMRRLAHDKIMFNVFGGEPGNHRFGILSEAERDEAVARVDEVIRGHLIDVDGTRMIVRERGGERAFDIPEGSWLINCTTHHLHRPHEHLLADDGLVCAPQNGAGLPGSSAYILTHLWFRDELASIAKQMYRVRLDVEPKLRFTPQIAMAVMANMVFAADRLPPAVFMRFEGDGNKWYPLHRQIASVFRMMTRRKQVLAKAERFLSLRYADPLEAVPFARRHLPAAGAAE